MTEKEPSKFKASIAYVIYKDQVGGAELGGVAASQLLATGGYKVGLYFLRKGSMGKRSPHSLLTLTKRIREADVIVSSISYASLICALIKRRKQKHIVLLTNTSLPFRHLLVYKILDAISRFNVAADSNKAVEYARTIFRGNVGKISLFFHHRDPRSIKNAVPHKVVTSIIRSAPVKGKDLLRELIIQMPNWNFRIFGLSASELNLPIDVQDRVRVTRFGTHEEIFDGKSIYIQPSRSESSILSVLEAMVHGHIVVATNVGQLPDYLGRRDEFLVDVNLPDEYIVREFKAKIEKIEFQPDPLIDKWKSVKCTTLDKYTSHHALASWEALLDLEL